MSVEWLLRAGRFALTRPPSHVAARAVKELGAFVERRFGPARAAAFDEKSLLRRTAASSLDDVVSRAASGPCPALKGRVDPDAFERLVPGGASKVLRRAEDAMLNRVDILGSGPIDLGREIDWSRDYKTGKVWERTRPHKIDYINPGEPSDVKMAWELSRQQWLIPLGQAYCLTGDERYAEKAASLMDHWISSNPYGMTVNWAIAMEPAMRVFTWVWLFHVFHDTRAWRRGGFLSRFLRSLYLHAAFIEGNLEKAYVNGNHYLSNAAGLVFAGLFFREGAAPGRWSAMGRGILEQEITEQVYDDGVDYEGSVPYHRFVLELFWFPARMLELAGGKMSDGYKDRLARMAGFTMAYSRPDGQAPLVGDADDARVLPLGGQDINDHRYLAGLVGWWRDDEKLIKGFSGPLDEIFWALGTEAAEALREKGKGVCGSAVFERGGAFIMKTERDHVFIDCGPVGLKGYGGHGHNDCLSFEAFLRGAPVFTDSGSYVYTASFEWCNRFRSSEYHNTPVIDEEEINRFVHPLKLWSLHDDAAPMVMAWRSGEDLDYFKGSHTGYKRLSPPVMPIREIALDKRDGVLAVRDSFERDTAGHSVRIPFHLSPEVDLEVAPDNSFKLKSRGENFIMAWDAPESWNVRVRGGWQAPSYGVKKRIKVIEFSANGGLAPLLVAVGNADSAAELLRRARGMVGAEK